MERQYELLSQVLLDGRRERARDGSEAEQAEKVMKQFEDMQQLIDEFKDKRRNQVCMKLMSCKFDDKLRDGTEF